MSILHVGFFIGVLTCGFYIYIGDSKYNFGVKKTAKKLKKKQNLRKFRRKKPEKFEKQLKKTKKSQKNHSKIRKKSQK